MKQNIITSLILMLMPLSLKALDYLGDINEHEFIAKIDAVDKQNPLNRMFGFPCYLMLKDGVPVLSNKLEVTGTELENSRKSSVLNITDLSAIDPKTKKVKEGNRYLEFIIRRNGWASDNYLLNFKIPFDVSDDENKMLEIKDKGIATMTWEDPKNQNVNIVSYWSGIKGEVSFDIEVIENTLGYETARTAP